MAGNTRILTFSEGVTVTAPSQSFLQASSFTTFANDAAFITAKGGAAAEGDAYGNSTDNHIHYYDGTSWRTVEHSLNNFVATVDPTVNEDSGDGYSVGSIWINVTDDQVFVCVDSTVAASVWRELIDTATVQTMSGAKTFSAITTVSNATSSTNTTTGALVVTGGVGIGENINVSGNAIITGNLTVNGTTTTVNTATLDVTDANITINKGGNQASATATSGLTVEMSDATDTSILYDSAATSRWKVGDVGSEVEVATISGVQVITGKDIDGGTASNTSRITVPKDTTTNLDALTDKQGTLAWDTTRNNLVGNDGASWIELGGGAGGINHISANPDAEAGIVGWATYADIAGTSPVDGTGGSPTTTFTQNGTTPLRENNDFVLTKDAANRQGEGASFDFSIDNADKHSVQSITFDATTSVNYADGDLRVYIYDVTNAAVIEPGPTELLAGEFGKFSTQFQTASNSTSYRLIFHVASINATAYTINIDNVVVGPSVRNFGTPQTDWVSYIPTGNWSSNITFSGFWRRVGDSMQVEGFATVSASGSTGQFTISLPSGFNIDTSKLTTTSVSYSINLGNAQINDAATGVYNGIVIYAGNTTHVSVKYLKDFAPLLLYSTVNETLPFGTLASGDSVKVSYIVPISGWGSTVQMSDDAETRVVAARYQSTSATAVNTATTTIIDFETINDDTHSSVTIGASWKFTAPVSGRYRVDAKCGGTISAGNWDEGETVALNIYKNGVDFAEIGFIEATASPASAISMYIYGGDYINLNQGDTIDLRVTQNTGVTVNFGSGVLRNFVSISLISGPSAIAANELVAFGARTSAGQSVASNPDVVYGTEDWDTHGAYDASTGIFTAPIIGKYHFSASLLFISTLTTSQTLTIQLLKNGTIEAQVGVSGTNNASQQLSPHINFDLDLVKDDTVKIKVNSPVAGTLNVTALNNVFTGHRLGF